MTHQCLPSHHVLFSLTFLIPVTDPCPGQRPPRSLLQQHEECFVLLPLLYSKGHTQAFSNLNIPLWSERALHLASAFS